MRARIGRRVAAALLAVVLFMPRPGAAGETWEAPRGLIVRPYPDPGIKALDPSFAKYTLYAAEVERLGYGFRWVEGPVWFGDGRYLLFSDVPNNQILRWDEATGAIAVHRRPSNYASGMTRDRQGRLIVCEHGTRRVTRTEPDGSVTVLADSYQGKRLNSPNDVIVRSDGSIWFTDPPFGIAGNYEGYKQEAELPHHGLYRIDGGTGEIALVADDIKGPNGLAFSPDESILYVVEGRAQPNRLILAYDVTGEGTGLDNKRVLVDCDGGMADGFCVDVDGNLWCGWGGSEEKNGVAVFNAEGRQIGFIKTPERIANLAFGGEKRTRLLMAGCKSLYSLFVEAQGAAPLFDR